MSSDEQQIRDLVDRWMSATRAGDIETVLTLMTDDVVFLVAGQQPFGKQVFAAASRAAVPGAPMPQIDGRSEIQEVHVQGDLAYMWSKLAVDVTPPNGGKVVKRAGYTLTVLRKTDGRWQIARDANLLVTANN